MKTTTFIFLLISSLSYSQTPNYIPTDSLIGWWPFNANALDEGVNGYNGTNYGAILTNDRFGNSNSAFNFSNLNSYIKLPNSTVAYKYTISCWLNIANVYDTSTFVSTQNLNTGNYYMNQVSMGYLYSQYSIPSTPSFGSAYALINNYNVPNSTWHHVLITYDGMTISQYLDGALLSSGSPGVAIEYGNMGDKYIGDRYNTFDGDIDDVGIWGKVLDSCEILDLYNASLGSCSSSTIQNDPLTIKLYPNPSNDFFNIDLTGHGEGYLMICDVLGKNLFDKDFNSNQVSLNVNRLKSKGTYFVKIFDDNKQLIAIKKLIYQ